MSEEEKFESIIKEIKEIYLFLTQQEPTPDDEIEARGKLIDKIQTLKLLNSVQVVSNIDLLEDTLNKLEKWDTLELWFVESELPEFIHKIISITEELPEIPLKDEYKEFPTTKLRKDLEKASIDIDEIVGKVSEQFKGEIDDLKHEIDGLKIELEKKDETLKKVSQMKVIKTITPKKDVKLPPPKIKIPSIKKPEKAPQIKAPIEHKAEKPIEKVGVTSMKQVQIKIEEELDKLKTPSIFKKKPEIETTQIPKSEDLELIPKIPEPKITSKPFKKPESILDILDESDKSQDDQISKMISELPEKPESIARIFNESEKSKKLTETPTFTAMPEKPNKKLKASQIIEINVSEEEKEVPFAIKEPKAIKKPEITVKPTITSVSIEEIETESIRSTGTELFNVFSSVGEKTTETIQELDETSEELPTKEKKKKKKEEKEVGAKSDATPFVEFSRSKPDTLNYNESETFIPEELPKDKDSLYQELIALEGKRYSLEKNLNEIEKSYNTGSIDDKEYENKSEELRAKLDSITSRINNLRRVISSL
ncbi:MAG: hypothetical protein ACFE9Q_15140 [Candidatus Hodarchaeota archaeon]